MSPTIVVHGGCGTPAGNAIADERSYHDALAGAVGAAERALTNGGAALDAAQAAVESLEDAPQFNAGRGSVLTADGFAEMDAAVMSGGRAGAVAAVETVRHPVALARAVMEATPHVMLVATGAERLASEQGLERMPREWFVTERQRERWWKAHGTVGAVVLDDAGRLAAATSTGGVFGQRAGRIGDTPLIGAGTYANERVAVSATGDGEGLVRAVAAHSVAALVEHAGLSLADACGRVVATVVGDAGLIAVDGDGNIALPFNTSVMHRAVKRGDRPVETAIWA
ncbi:MAG: L-asparaginase / beta-aspartyl-peptidase [Thermoleophilales bacterium]|nr:L-asparaginase / beta-aspartyl-peptidase [Thermoleophilales bacterium]